MSCSCCAGNSHSEETREPFIDPSTLAQKCQLDNRKKIFKYHMTRPEPNRCRLQSLPIELYQACLQHLDLATLTSMRRVSQFTRYTIDSLHQYQEIYEHAPQALRACLVTCVTPHIPLRQLHYELTSMECYYCKTTDPPTTSFGAYLSLYQCHRTCLFCLRNNAILKPLELPTLISLCTKRKCSIRSLSNLNQISTIPGTYGPLSTFHTTRNTLVRAPSVSSASLSEKEQRILFGPENTATIHHHPSVNPEEESDIAPQQGYISPETPKKIAQTFMSAIPFPYLPTSKTAGDYGVLCEECYLHMLFEDKRWKEEQLLRRMNFQDPTASERTRERINRARREACMQYFEGEDAVKDTLQLEEERRKGLSLREHRETHRAEKLSTAEKEFRAKMKKGSPSYRTKTNGVRVA